MIETVLIANRGEIARRVLRTCREMGIRSVAVYSDADKDMPFVAEADLALRLGPPPAAESYLDIEKLITLAVGNGVDAIHPGYGFLAENPAFSAACAEAGLVFIGPAPEVIRAMGDKAEAKRRMEEAGVPIVPGYSGDDQDPETLLAAAREIGFPVLLKAVAGGGGRGIRLVQEEEALATELESAQREARNAFGDERVMVEKFLERPRHVEFQVMADRQGTVLHLYERECSVQRRHQKVVEETPSPALDEALRGRMAEAAVRAAEAIGYLGAGTVEFLVDRHGAFYFLEMNTRLQVEHPVTELTLGLDLVRLQIEVAEGRPLRLRQEEIRPHGHAIECRVNAEDPARNFLPAVGRLNTFDFPRRDGLRVDSGYARGSQVSPYYDSLLAKLVAWGPTREEALRRMSKLLEESRVAGIASNLAFLQGIVAHPEFRGGDYSTAFLEVHLEALTDGSVPEQLGRERLLAAAAVEAWVEWQRQVRHPRYDRAGEPNPWRHMDEAPRLRLLPAVCERRFTFNGSATDVTISVLPGAGRALAITATWDGFSHRFGYVPLSVEDSESHGDGLLDLDELRLPMRWDAVGEQRWASLRNRHLRYAVANPAELAGRGGAGAEADQRLRAPLPGKVGKISVAAGERVKAEQVLLVLEAMKMEHKITAPYRGTVKQLLYAEGDLVNRDELLLELEPDA